MREGRRRGEDRRESEWAGGERLEADSPGFPFSIEEEPPVAGRRGADRPPRRGVDRPPRRGGSESKVPLILPGGRRAPSRHRHREPLLWAFAFLLVGGALGWALLAPMDGDAPSDVAEFRTVTRPEADGAPWEDAAAAFSDAAAAYGERARDFDLGRLGCAGLRRGFQTTEDAFAELSGRLAAAGAEGPAARAGEEARRAMRDVERHFEASGCPVESSAQ